MWEESIENIIKSHSNSAPTFVDRHLLPDMNFDGHCLIKKDISIPKKVINLYFYTLGPRLRNLNKYFTLGNRFFRSEELTKNADLDKDNCTGYDIGFDSRSEYLFTDRSYGKKSLFLELIWAHLRMGKDILILGEGPAQRLDDTTLTAAAKYPINFTQSGKRFVLSLHNNGSNIFLFVDAVTVYQFKAKNQK